MPTFPVFLVGADVRDDGTPIDPSTYDYQRAARDAIHFAALFDRLVRNLRRFVDDEVQYFAAVEPQKRFRRYSRTSHGSRQGIGAHSRGACAGPALAGCLGSRPLRHRPRQRPAGTWLRVRLGKPAGSCSPPTCPGLTSRLHCCPTSPPGPGPGPGPPPAPARTRIGVSSPARCNRANRLASCLSAFTRSPARRGISDGGTTSQATPSDDSSRCNWTWLRNS
jgi:hypothetical protein